MQRPHGTAGACLLLRAEVGGRVGHGDYLRPVDLVGVSTGHNGRRALVEGVLQPIRAPVSPPRASSRAGHDQPRWAELPGWHIAVLVGASIGALVRAIRSRRGIVLTSVGLAAILGAGIAGSSFVRNQSNGASFGMALATAVAMFCYLAAVFGLR